MKKLLGPIFVGRFVIFFCELCYIMLQKIIKIFAKIFLLINDIILRWGLNIFCKFQLIERDNF